MYKMFHPLFGKYTIPRSNSELDSICNSCDVLYHIKYIALASKKAFHSLIPFSKYAYQSIVWAVWLNPCYVRHLHIPIKEKRGHPEVATTKTQIVVNSPLLGQSKQTSSGGCTQTSGSPTSIYLQADILLLCKQTNLNDTACHSAKHAQTAHPNIQLFYIFIHSTLEKLSN